MTENEFYTAWWYLVDNDFNIDTEVALVNPATLIIDNDPSKNTKTQVWLESGKGYEVDHRLDCGADTYEQAIIKLAKLVKKYYSQGAMNV